MCAMQKYTTLAICSKKWNQFILICYIRHFFSEFTNLHGQIFLLPFSRHLIKSMEGVRCVCNEKYATFAICSMKLIYSNLLYQTFFQNFFQHKICAMHPLFPPFSYFASFYSLSSHFSQINTTCYKQGQHLLNAAEPQCSAYFMWTLVLFKHSFSYCEHYALTAQQHSCAYRWPCRMGLLPVRNAR